MEFLKELFGDQPLTYDQLAEKATKQGMKLADLSTGRYVGKDKYDALSAEKNGLNQRLTEANTKLEGYDPDWKTKAQQAQSQADAEVAKIKRSYLLRKPDRKHQIYQRIGTESVPQRSGSQESSHPG